MHDALKLALGLAIACAIGCGNNESVKSPPPSKMELVAPGTFPTVDAGAPTVVASSKAAAASPYEGLRVRNPNEKQVYLVLDGTRRWIQTAEAYNRLFDSWDPIRVDATYESVPIGPPIAADVLLVRRCQCGLGGWCAAPVYLWENHFTSYRWISSPEAMARYGFSWAKVGGDCPGNGTPPPASVMGPPINAQ